MAAAKTGCFYKFRPIAAIVEALPRREKHRFATELSSCRHATAQIGFNQGFRRHGAD
jgi:hypothetical protein